MKTTEAGNADYESEGAIESIQVIHLQMVNLTYTKSVLYIILSGQGIGGMRRRSSPLGPGTAEPGVDLF